MHRSRRDALLLGLASAGGLTISYKVVGYNHNMADGFVSLRPALVSAGQGRIVFRNLTYRARGDLARARALGGDCATGGIGNSVWPALSRRRAEAIWSRTSLRRLGVAGPRENQK